MRSDFFARGAVLAKVDWFVLRFIYGRTPHHPPSFFRMAVGAGKGSPGTAMVLEQRSRARLFFHRADKLKIV
jgi:hypothetical protein